MHPDDFSVGRDGDIEDADLPPEGDVEDPLEDPAETAQNGGRRPRVRRRHAILLGVGAVLASLVVSVVAAGFYLRGNIETLDVGDALADPGSAEAVVQAAAGADDSVPDQDPADGGGDPLNILVMGSDTRKGQGGGYGSAQEIEGARSDTTLLVHIAGNRDSVTVLSIPRDLVTTIPPCRTPEGAKSARTTDRFNAAFFIGGPECTIRTVTALTGLPINHFAVVDFAGFREVVDALGGVEVCVDEPVSDPLANLYLEPGVHRIRGEQALGFVRTRTGGLGDGSDLARIERQQEFLASMVREATSLSILGNPLKLFNTLSAVTKSLTVDPGLTDVMGMVTVAQSLAQIGPANVSFVTLPNYYSEDFITVRMDSRAARPILDALAHDRPWPAPIAEVDDNSLAMRPAAVRLAVMDRSSRGNQGERAAAHLEGLGFEVGDVWTGDATRRTQVRYGDGFKRQAAVVAASFDGAAVVADPALSGVRLVLGKDFDPGSFRQIPNSAFQKSGKKSSDWKTSQGSLPSGSTKTADTGTCVS